MDKEKLVHIYPGIFLSHKKEQNKAICSNMDGQDDYLPKLSISEKDKYHMISPTCRIFKKMIQINVYLQNRNKLTDIENNLMVTKGMGERDKLGTGSNIYTLFYVKQITNKDLLQQGTLFNIL